jgi:drug/metabolite transporter (DMT)-like permease
MLLALAGIWGGSFLLIEVALEDLEPTVVITLRVVSGAIALIAAAPFLANGGLWAELRDHAGPLAVLGLVNTAVPFFLITWGQQYIDSGVAAILNASAPLFTALLALFYHRSQRVTGSRLVGFLVGFAGVALVAGANPDAGGRVLLGSLAVVVAAVFYAFGALYAGRRLPHVSPLGLSLGTLLFATLFTLPAALFQLPEQAPGAESLAAALALGILATAVGYLLYYALISGAGASRAILVTYLVPALAVLYGVTLLDEPLEASALAGLALVLLGVALGTGTVRPGRRVAADSVRA